MPHAGNYDPRALRIVASTVGSRGGRGARGHGKWLPSGEVIRSTRAALNVLELNGYQPAPTTGDALLDAREAARMRCDACDAAGMRYTTFRRHGSLTIADSRDAWRFRWDVACGGWLGRDWF